MSLILGVDPGSLRTGWGVIDSLSLHCIGHGVIHLSDKWTFAKRLACLLQQMDKVLMEYKPDAASIEKVFFGKNPDSAFKLGHARGVAVAVCGQHQLPVHEYATRHVKKVLTGMGGATKEQVQFMVEKILRRKVDEMDASDALALAICHAREMEVQNLLNSESSVIGLNTQRRNI